MKVSRLIARSVPFFVLLITTACSLLQTGEREEIDSLPGGVTYSDFSSSVPELFEAASDLLADGDFSEAEALYRQIINAEPESPHGYIAIPANTHGLHRSGFRQLQPGRFPGRATGVCCRP